MLLLVLLLLPLSLYHLSCKLNKSQLTSEPAFLEPSAEARVVLERLLRRIKMADAIRSQTVPLGLAGRFFKLLVLGVFSRKCSCDHP